MPEYPYRELKPTPEAEETYRRWLRYMDTEIGRHKEPRLRNEFVRDTLHQIYFARPHGGKLNLGLQSELAFNSVEMCMDPANVTLEPEYYGDVDHDKYEERKPLIYFWQMFDRSPMAINHWLGFRFRAMLGKHIFAAIGKNVKIFHGVEFSYGYNLTIEDDCTIHKYVMLDDRGELIIKKGTSLSDYAAVYSHAHHPKNQADVQNRRTEIGPGARITFHAAVMAGVHVGENAILGALGVATKDIAPNAIAGGVPAKQIKSKDDVEGDGWEESTQDQDGDGGQQRNDRDPRHDGQQ